MIIDLNCTDTPQPCECCGAEIPPNSDHEGYPGIAADFEASKIREQALAAANAKLRDALEEIKRECDDNIDCNHQDADDGSDDCTDVDDCVGCTIKMLADRALAAVPAESLEEVRRQAMQRMVNVARGCHDYGGGYRGTDHFDAYQAGIATVVSALEHRIKDDTSTQSNALEMMGRAAELRKGGK